TSSVYRRKRASPIAADAPQRQKNPGLASARASLCWNRAEGVGVDCTAGWTVPPDFPSPPGDSPGVSQTKKSARAFFAPSRLGGASALRYTWLPGSGTLLVGQRGARLLSGRQPAAAFPGTKFHSRSRLPTEGRPRRLLRSGRYPARVLAAPSIQN